MRMPRNPYMSDWAYYELRGFCRQYEEKKKTAADILLRLGSGIPHGGTGGTAWDSSTVERKAIQREKLLADIALIEDSARAVEGGKWYRAIIKTSCQGVYIRDLGPEDLPTFHLQSFYKARQYFYYLLYTKRCAYT